MRQLDTCDFCGAAPDGVYEVVPASVAGDPKRLALCADCRDTLQTVVDPLLDAATEQRDSNAGRGPRSDSPPAESTTQSTPPTHSGTAIDDAIENTGERDADPSDDTAATSDDESAATDVAGSGDDGVTIEAGDGSEVADSDGAEDGTDGDETEADAADASEAAAGGSRARRPDGYAQIIRLLQNRDSAMPREDLRALATNAYDLSGREFETAVEAAVDNGDVEETGSGLRTA